MFIALSILFFAGSIVTGFVLARFNHRGTGFGDGYIVTSCYTPGGPYYVHRLPPSLQPCPNKH
jgi:hypothetical protein